LLNILYPGPESKAQRLKGQKDKRTEKPKAGIAWILIVLIVDETIEKNKIDICITDGYDGGTTELNIYPWVGNAREYRSDVT
jgi:hypothetical protein